MPDQSAVRPLATATPRQRHAIDPFALLALPVAAFVLFVGLPLVALTYRALQTGQVVERITSPVVRDALWITAITSTVALLIAVVLGTPVAYLLARASFPGKRILDTLVDLPLVLPPVVVGVALLMAFGRRGVLGMELERIGVELAFSTKAVVLAQVFVAMPFYIRAAKAGFQSVDPDLIGISYTLGVSRVATFWRVTLPLARPAVLGGVVLCWARAVSEFGATIMFAGNLRGSTQTLPLAIVSTMESDLFAALTISVLLLVLACLILGALRFVSRSYAE